MCFVVCDTLHQPWGMHAATVSFCHGRAPTDFPCTCRSHSSPRCLGERSGVCGFWTGVDYVPGERPHHHNEVAVIAGSCMYTLALSCFVHTHPPPPSPGPLQGVVRLFGQEILKLWTAVLLKKRVVVYCPVLQDLLRLMRSIPQLAWHRHVRLLAMCNTNPQSPRSSACRVAEFDYLAMLAACPQLFPCFCTATLCRHVRHMHASAVTPPQSL